MATYYVTTSGSDSNNGLSEANAFATPGYASGQATTSGDKVYIKEGTYSLSTATQNVSGGTLNIARGVQVEGYKTTIGDRAAKPVISTNSVTVAGSVVAFSSPHYNVLGSYVISLEVDGQNTANSGFNNAAGNTGLLFDCVARNCGIGFTGDRRSGTTVNCEAHDCTSSGFLNGSLTYCWADSCQIGFSSNIDSMDSCIASNSTSHGFSATVYPVRWKKCVAINNGGDGFSTSLDIGFFSQMISVSNSGYGYKLGNANGTMSMFDCADYNNTSGRTFATNTSRDFRPINLTADPFVDSANLDFRINDVAGGGSELRQIQLSGLAGVNGVFDVGAIDAVVTSSGGGATIHPLYAN